MDNKKIGVAAETFLMQEAIGSALMQEAMPYVCLEMDEKADFMRKLKSLSGVIVACESAGFLKKTVNFVRSFSAEPVKLIVYGRQALFDMTEGAVGKVDFLPYRSLSCAGERELFCQELLLLMRRGTLPAELQKKAAGGRESGHFVVIGASAGGPGAVLSVLSKLPASTCGILLVQHLSRGFSREFSEYLNQRCEMTVAEACSGNTVRDGVVYVAPDEKHMTVRRNGGSFAIQCRPGQKVNGVCPSVDCLMKSAAAAGKNAMGIILTGMGADGAQGLLAMKNAGAYTIAQDEKTSVIYSMPREAVLLGGALKQLPIEAIAAEIQKFCLSMSK